MKKNKILLTLLLLIFASFSLFGCDETTTNAAGEAEVVKRFDQIYEKLPDNFDISYTLTTYTTSDTSTSYSDYRVIKTEKGFYFDCPSYKQGIIKEDDGIYSYKLERGESIYVKTKLEDYTTLEEASQLMNSFIGAYMGYYTVFSALQLPITNVGTSEVVERDCTVYEFDYSQYVNSSTATLRFHLDVETSCCLKLEMKGTITNNQVGSPFTFTFECTSFKTTGTLPDMPTA